MVLQQVNNDGFLSEEEIQAFVHKAAGSMNVDGKRVLFIVPDHTRSMPMDIMFRAMHSAIHDRVAKMDFLIALGTHPPEPPEVIYRLFGITEEARNTTFADVGIFNHEWKNEDALANIGTMTEDDIEELSQGRLRQRADVLVNKRVLDYDLLCIMGPVFPHEVVGFSGGNKYFFPGVAGADILNLFHWLGALITNATINGTKHTPVRDVINRAAAMIPAEKCAFCLNVVRKNTKAIYFGTPEEAWEEAADLSATTHIIYKERPFKSVLAMAPDMYEDLWVAGKCMYKLEPVVADGGELIIYGKHVREVSVTHGELIERIGYHIRDYFTAQMERFRDIPGGILAHSTHVRGGGVFENGVEIPRVSVTLATGIPEETCRRISLGYRDPDAIDPEAWRNREDEGLLLVENAGEILYRLQ
ncbi:MAG: lactate racemase domain-containing protein [Candidatus Hydrogenedentota bacterium]